MTDFMRVRRIIIITLVAMVLFSFVALINLHFKVEDIIQANNEILNYIEMGK
jgi:hypothetical protein